MIILAQIPLTLSSNVLLTQLHAQRDLNRLLALMFCFTYNLCKLYTESHFLFVQPVGILASKVAEMKAQSVYKV